jgi:thymidine phosphorylase
MTVQTAEITPADRKLYALRDVTGTVASIPLIVASILSKKLAEGSRSLVFDVKCGSGAFMKSREEAEELARALVGGARAAGRKAAALVTDMSAPLGSAVGNANEVAEAVSVLKLPPPPGNGMVDLSVELAAMMVSLAKDVSLDESRAECRERLADGSAYGRFKAMVEAHGGDLARFEKVLQAPVFKFRIQAMRSGYVAGIDAEKVARAAFALGAGRAEQGDRIDPLAGVELAVSVGDRVVAGAPLATLQSGTGPDGMEKCAAELYRAFRISAEPAETPSLIISRVD